MSANELPKAIRRHPAASEYTSLAAEPTELTNWNSSWPHLGLGDHPGLIASSPVAVPRLGPTLWYAPGGNRQVLITRDDEKITVHEVWTKDKRSYGRVRYQGHDIYAAVKAANEAFDQLREEGYKSHTQCLVGVQEWFGLDTRWDRDVFDAEDILDSLRAAEVRREREQDDDYDRREYARASGLLSDSVAAPGERSRPSALAERQLAY